MLKCQESVDGDNVRYSLSEASRTECLTGDADTRPSSGGTPILSNVASYIYTLHLSLTSSIGGLVVKLAVAIRGLFLK